MGIMAQSDQQIIDAVNEAVAYAMELAAEEEGRKAEKEQGEAVIKTKKNKDGRKVWLCTATVNVSPSLLWEKMKDTQMIVGGLSVVIEEQPEVKGIVRANHGAGCQIVVDTGDSDKCQFIWLMDCDYRGLIPTSIVEIAMPSAQLQMIDCINKLSQ